MHARGEGHGDGHATRPSVAQISGEILLTISAILALFVVYELYWTDLTSARLQARAATDLDERWAGRHDQTDPAAAATPAPLPPPVLGEAFARVHLPALGTDAHYVVVEGTRPEDLRTGPGHYEETQLPGEPGNVALAGHRNGSGGVFEHLDRLAPCDAVVMETATQWLTYRLVPDEVEPDARRATAGRCLSPEQVERFAVGDYSHVRGLHVTTPDAVEVIAPLPGVTGAGGAESTVGPGLERMLTLTTCHPLYSNAERLIVHAVLTDTTSKSAGLPDALEE